jgi:hypothetical protein
MKAKFAGSGTMVTTLPAKILPAVGYTLNTMVR